MPLMKAKRPIRYGARSYLPGAAFPVDKKHVRILLATGKVEEVTEPQPIPKRSYTRKIVEPDDPVADLVIPQIVPTVAPDAEEPEKPKRKYTRRDMTAES